MFSIVPFVRLRTRRVRIRRASAKKTIPEFFFTDALISIELDTDIDIWVISENASF